LTQDWTPAVLTKSPIRVAPRNAKALASAIKAGEVETVKRFDAGKNAGGVAASAVISAAKLEAETVDFKHATIPHEFKMALMQARTAKHLTQADLAKLMNVKSTIIQDYELGKAIPTPALIAKFNRALGVTLPKFRGRRRRWTTTREEVEKEERTRRSAEDKSACGSTTGIAWTAWGACHGPFSRSRRSSLAQPLADSIVALLTAGRRHLLTCITRPFERPLRSHPFSRPFKDPSS